MSTTMIKVATIIAALFFFYGCADKSAYSKFGLNSDEERAFDNVKVTHFSTKEGKNIAVMAAVHLNAVYPKRCKENECFYLLFVPKEKRLLRQMHLTLNDHPVLELKKLPSKNEYAHLLNMEAKWSDFYFARFAKENNTTLLLHVEIGEKASANVTFEKTQ